MVFPGLGDREQNQLAVWLREVGVGRVSAELRDSDVAVSRGRVVEDIEEAARPVVGREGKREEARLARELHLIVEVEEGSRQNPSVTDDPDGARLLDDEDSVGIIRWSGHENRSVERR